MPATWVPTVVLSTPQPELLTVALPVPPVAPPPPVVQVQPPVVVPAPPVYQAPVRPPKQDRH